VFTPAFTKSRLSARGKPITRSFIWRGTYLFFSSCATRCEKTTLAPTTTAALPVRPLPLTPPKIYIGMHIYIIYVGSHVCAGGGASQLRFITHAKIIVCKEYRTRTFITYIYIYSHMRV